MAVQRQRQHEADDHAGGQQPAALLSPTGLLDDPIDEIWWEGAGQRAERDPVGDRRRRGQLGGCGGRHPVAFAPSQSGKERTLPRQSSKPDGIVASPVVATVIPNGMWRRPTGG